MSVPKKIVFATNNEHKLKEARNILKEYFDILSLTDIGFSGDIAETGSTFEENSKIKAHHIKDKYGYDCFADDSGLEVVALDGAPGVHSARFAALEGRSAEAHNSEANMQLLLEKMKGVTDREANFTTSIALILGDEEYIFNGRVDGHLLEEPIGSGGFGYDPIFVPEGYDLSFAQMTEQEKNQLSHRGRALNAMIEFLEKIDK